LVRRRHSNHYASLFSAPLKAIGFLFQTLTPLITGLLFTTPPFTKEPFSVFFHGGCERFQQFGSFLSEDAHKTFDSRSDFSFRTFAPSRFPCLGTRFRLVPIVTSVTYRFPPFFFPTTHSGLVSFPFFLLLPASLNDGLSFFCDNHSPPLSNGTVVFLFLALFRPSSFDATSCVFGLGYLCAACARGGPASTAPFFPRVFQLCERFFFPGFWRFGNWLFPVIQVSPYDGGVWHFLFWFDVLAPFLSGVEGFTGWSPLGTCEFEHFVCFGGCLL